MRATPAAYRLPQQGASPAVTKISLPLVAVMRGVRRYAKSAPRRDAPDDVTLTEWPRRQHACARG